eukprot:SAG11_NODE_1325_length_5198_cov_3.028045_4_plen_54_part_00
MQDGAADTGIHPLARANGIHLGTGAAQDRTENAVLKHAQSINLVSWSPAPEKH